MKIFNPYAKKRPRPNPTLAAQPQQHHINQHSSPAPSIANNRLPCPSSMQQHNLQNANLKVTKSYPVQLCQNRPIAQAFEITLPPNSTSNNDNVTIVNPTSLPNSSSAANTTTSKTSSTIQIPVVESQKKKQRLNSSTDWDQGTKVCTNASKGSSSSSDKKRESLDSLGDSSIDWEEAIRIIDSKLISATSGHSQQQQCTEPTCALTISTQQNHTTVYVDRSSRSRSVTNSIIPLKKQPPGTNAQKNHSMASLRPSSWSKCTSTSTNANVTHVPQLSQQFLSQEGNVQSIPGAARLHPTVAMLPQSLQFAPDSIRPVQDEHRKTLVKHADISKPLDNGWTLFNHQKKAILKGLAMRRFILALDMGLGKTLIGCVWARAFHKTFENCKIIVICPVSLKKEWTRTATETTGLPVEVDEVRPKQSKFKKDEDTKAVRDDSTETNNSQNQGPKMEIYSWAKVPTTVDESIKNYVVVCDEAHSLQSMQATRTRDLLTLVTPKRCVGVLLLTGTPMSKLFIHCLHAPSFCTAHVLGQRAYYAQPIFMILSLQRMENHRICFRS